MARRTAVKLVTCLPARAPLSILTKPPPLPPHTPGALLDARKLLCPPPPRAASLRGGVPCPPRPREGGTSSPGPGSLAPPPAPRPASLSWRPERPGLRQQSARWLAAGQSPIGGRGVPAVTRWRPGKQGREGNPGVGAVVRGLGQRRRACGGLAVPPAFLRPGRLGAALLSSSLRPERAALASPAYRLPRAGSSLPLPLFTFSPGAGGARP